MFPGHSDNYVAGILHSLSQNRIVGSLAGEEDIIADGLGLGVCQILDSLSVERAGPLRPSAVLRQGLIIYGSDNDVR